MNKHFRFSGSTLQRLEELGVRAPAVLRRAGLPQAFINQARALLNTEELFALWRAVGEVSTDPSIGLLLGTETKTERFHPIGLAALSSENFGSAIDQMARYKQLTCPEEILQEKDDEEWSIQFRWLLADEVEPPVLIECCLGGRQGSPRKNHRRPGRFDRRAAGRVVSRVAGGGAPRARRPGHRADGRRRRSE